jgi:hypothetical protein
MAAPTETRTPNWHRANIAHQRVRMEGWRQRRPAQAVKTEGKLLLTRTGLHTMPAPPPACLWLLNWSMIRTLERLHSATVAVLVLGVWLFFWCLAAEASK